VRFAGFGDYSLKVEIRVDINTANRDEFRAIREDIYLRITRDTEPDSERREAAEAQVRAWCSAQELRFPTFTADYRKKVRNTLDYPPEGSPGASQ